MGKALAENLGGVGGVRNASSPDGRRNGCSAVNNDIYSEICANFIEFCGR